jgi:hypothetical protein
MSMEYTPSARRLGISTSIASVVVSLAYAVTLGVGLASLKSPDDAIGDPMFTLMEILIIVLMPLLVGLIAALYTRASVSTKPLVAIALVFIGLSAGLTSSLHFMILALSRQQAFIDMPSSKLFLSFDWPSIPYALDILAWDVFFALAMLFAAPSLTGSRLANAIRYLMIISGVLSLAGLSGVALNNMQLRNIGVAGYLGVFLMVAALLTLLFHREGAAPATEANSRRSHHVA